MKKEEVLPKAEDMKIELDLVEIKECLRYLPVRLKDIRDKFQKALQDAGFWNFLRDCKYLEFERADFHLTGLGTPAWHLYCKHRKNKSGKEGLYILLQKEIKDKITGQCDKDNCPIYHNKCDIKVLPKDGIQTLRTRCRGNSGQGIFGTK